MSIDLTTARVVVAGAQECARLNHFKPLTIVVLDRGGHLVTADRADGSANKRFEIAFGKASGALAFGMGSRALMARAEQQPYFIAAATHAIGGALIPVPGGVLIRDQSGQLTGAVGVSGDTSENDEAAAVAGVLSAGLSPQPD